ncbi:MAG: glycosyltransferase family 4 protein [Chloroflexota bacterium]
MRLALITPLVDPANPLLGFIHTWVGQLAERVDHLSVLQLWRSAPALPSNVDLYSLDRSGPGGKAAVLARLSMTLARLCWRGRLDGVIAHMGPIFAVCAAPVVKPARIPLALWYAHGAVSPMLRLAHQLVDRAGTSTPDGFRIPSTKLTITGQGIDTMRFAPRGQRDDRLIVSIGRISPVKHYETVIHAMADLRARGESDVRLRIIGGVTLPSEYAYREKLTGLVQGLELSRQVEIVEGIPHDQIASEYQRAGLFVSCSQTGSLDKAVLEAASAGALPITTNPALGEFFEEARSDHMPSESPDCVAALMQYWLNQPSGVRMRRAAVLRERVVRNHSVHHLADELVRLVRPIRPAQRGLSLTGDAR